MLNIATLNFSHLGRQRGAVLAISLIMLLLLTIIGITASQITGLEEKMTGNMRERNTAFQAAETALRAGETFLATEPVLPVFIGNNGLYGETGTPPGQNDDWSKSNFSKKTYAGSLSHTASAPLYVIQRVTVISRDSVDGGDYKASEVYRVTARGVGGTSSSVVVLQSVYKR